MGLGEREEEGMVCGVWGVGMEVLENGHIGGTTDCRDEGLMCMTTTD